MTRLGSAPEHLLNLCLVHANGNYEAMAAGVVKIR